MKRILKVSVFIIVFLVLWKICFSFLRIDANSISNFYKEPKNSIDVAYFGASNAYAHFNTVLAYKEYGFTTAMLSTSVQPYYTIKYLMKECNKYQNPKVNIIDISNTYSEPIEYKEVDYRKVFDSTKFSIDKLKTIKETMKYQKNVNVSEYEYYFSFLKYHGAWKYINKEKYYRKDLFKGFLLEELTSKIEPQKESVWEEDNEKLSQDIIFELNNLISYIKDNNLETIFVISNRTYSINAMKKLNTVTEILENANMKVINFNKIDDLKIDFSHDLYNSGHINVWGATKFTEYFAKYLKENYNLEDHRNDAKYASWDKEYDRFKEEYNRLTGRNFEDLLRYDEK